MKKFFVMAVAVLASAAMVAPAFAEHKQISAKGYYQFRGVTSDNIQNLNDDDQSDEIAGAEQRVRVWVVGSPNEYVQGVVGLEMDYAYGNNEGTIGADQKGELEIKHSYLDFKIPETSISARAGIQAIALGSSIIIDTDAAAVTGKVGDLGIYWVKVEEGSTAANSEDSDLYAATYTIKAGDMTFKPVLAFQNGVDQADGDRATALFIGTDFAAKFGGIGLNATALFNDWEAGNMDGSGIALKAKASMKAGSAAVYAEVAYMGDKDNQNGEFYTVKTDAGAAGTAYLNPFEILTGGKFDNRGTGVGSQTTLGQDWTNIMYLKVGGKVPVSDKSNIEAAIGYAQSAEDLGADTVTFGTEIDAYYNYMPVDNVTITLGGGYLLADDEFAEYVNGAGASADNAYKLGLATTVSF